MDRFTQNDPERQANIAFILIFLGGASLKPEFVEIVRKTAERVTRTDRQNGRAPIDGRCAVIKRDTGAASNGRSSARGGCHLPDPGQPVNPI